jgi:hypothetical protein
MPTTPLTTSPQSHADRDGSLQEELIEEMFSETDDLGEPVTDGSVTEEPASTDDEINTVLDAQADDPQPTTAEQAEPPVDPSLAHRTELQRRLAGSTRLPPALRNRFAELVEQAAWNESGEEQPALSISQAITWLEQALPRQFRLDAAALEPSVHPAGDVFFSGHADSLDDQQAADLAAQQLAATGFGP